MFRMRPGAACALLVPCLLASLAGSASGARPDRKLNENSVTDPTGGAVARVELWQRGSDGAVYPRIWVSDTKADGICAHAAMRWVHNNGNTYDDTPSWACGAGESKDFTKGPRNWTQYRSVAIAAYVDHGAPAGAPLYDFAAKPPTFEDDGVPVVPVEHNDDGGGNGAIGGPSPYRAGRHIRINGEDPDDDTHCTAAFVVTTKMGVGGLTAGHCATGAYTGHGVWRAHAGDGVWLELSDKHYAGLGNVAVTLAKGIIDRRKLVNGTDAMMFSIGDYPYEQVIARGKKTPWKVTGMVPTILQEDGIKVCFAGRTSGADQCGEIRSGSVGHLKCTDIKAEGGDSGGAVYMRPRNGKTRAVGIVSRRDAPHFWQEGRMCYEPIERVLDELHAELAGLPARKPRPPL